MSWRSHARHKQLTDYAGFSWKHDGLSCGGLQFCECELQSHWSPEVLDTVSCVRTVFAIVSSSCSHVLVLQDTLAAHGESARPVQTNVAGGLRYLLGMWPVSLAAKQYFLYLCAPRQVFHLLTLRLYDFRHKRFFVFRQLLTLEEIPCHTIRQGPGEYVFTFPEALHMVSNEGFNVAEAINFVTKAWAKNHVKTIAKCTCALNEEQQLIKIHFNNLD